MPAHGPRVAPCTPSECSHVPVLYVFPPQIDEHDPNPGAEAAYLRWGEEVFRALQDLPPVRTAAGGVMEEPLAAHPMPVRCSVLTPARRVRSVYQPAIGPSRNPRSHR